ncbi:amino acid-binding protein [uncultured Dialister sp.]|jgi:chorismate mutase|uniref:amino acid-binding protein n=1 Tax=Dialister sp. TaxID=1955814 RepID=UPI0025D8B858|nr:amino acid-binding protein [uncultured Dialister sp.]
MNKEKQQFYLVDLKILPEAIKKTIKVKEMLENGTSSSINEAVHRIGMSRSAYYKYKDHVAPVHSDKEDRIVVLFIIMQDEVSIFGRILRRIAREDNEVLSAVRTKASDSLYTGVITFKTEESSESLAELHDSLEEMKGIQSLTMKLGGETK